MGGFSLRSKKLLTALSDSHIIASHPEDACICKEYRSHLESKHNITFPSAEFAKNFSFEFLAPSPQSFGFHGMHNFPNTLETNDFINFIKIMPDEFILSGYYHLLLINCSQLKLVEPLKALLNQATKIILTLKDDQIQSIKCFDLTKTFIKVRFFKLAIQLIQVRIRSKGFTFDNLKLLTRLVFTAVYLH